MKKLLTLITFLALFTSIFSVSTVFAQTATPAPTPSQRINPPDEAPPSGINLTLSPVFLNLTTDPGKAVTSQLRVTNNNNFREYLEIDVKKFTASSDGGSPVISDAEPSDDFIEWVSFSEEQFTLDPNQTKTVRFTITPPESANLGYYYSFVVQRIQDPERTGQGAAISGSPAMPVLLLVRSPNAKREVQIVDFKTDKTFYEYLPTEFKISVKNSGNVHVAPSGDIFIDSMFNREVAILSANKGRGNVLPQTQRDYTASWDDGLIVRVPKMENGVAVQKDGKTVYETKFDFDKPLSKFRFGKYTANLILVYDNGERDVPIEAQVSFWIFPWKLIIFGVFIVLSPFLLFMIYGKIRGKRR